MAELRLTNELLTELQRLAFAGEAEEYYIKACVARVGVHVINPMNGEPHEIILKGDITDPDVNVDEVTVALYTEPDREYFLRKNRPLIRQGLLVQYTPEFKEEMMVNAITDEEIKEALSKPFIATRNLLRKFTSPIPVERMLRHATLMDVSAGYISAIEERLAELQADEYSSSDDDS